MKRVVPSAACLAGTAPALAQEPADPIAPVPERVERVVVYGDDPCPPSTGDEITVCARLPETERYRIPEELRDEATEDDPESEAWASRVESFEYVGATGIQRCSPVGPSGFPGCWAQMVRQARPARPPLARDQPHPQGGRKNRGE